MSEETKTQQPAGKKEAKTEGAPREKAPAKPWEGAEGLEWELPSPAPYHSFETPPKLDATGTKIVG